MGVADVGVSLSEADAPAHSARRRMVEALAMGSRVVSQAKTVRGSSHVA